MSDQYLGEIRIFGFNFAPQGWAFASGQLLPIQQYTALFSLIGTYYGGNGTSNFQLPNLAARTFAGAGQGPGLSQRFIGETFGSQTHTLTIGEMPSHTHPLTAYTKRGETTTATPDQNSALTAAVQSTIYGTGSINTALSPLAVSAAGGSVGHENRQPFLAMNYCIALSGIFPQRP